jgi:D-alanyl-D-alanine carboxypeptidase
MGRWAAAGLLAFVGCTSPPAASPLADYLESAGFSGVALVERSGTDLLEAGFGYADIELGVPNAPDLIYRIGSLTKPLTATAVLHAVESGHLELQDSLCDYVTTCPDDWGAVQVRHLLNHTSGIPDLFGSLPDAPLLQTTEEVDRLLERADIPSLTVSAGTEYTYSNFNYVLLGYIIRSATGQDWEQYLRSSILEPVDALDTGYDDVWALLPRRARGYGMEEGELRHVEYTDHSAYAAGGLRSTVDDLRRWHEALVRGRIISREHVQASMTPNAGGYGYGWQVISGLGRELQNHSGGIGGFASHMAWYPSDELLIVLLSNVEGTPTKALACDLARLVLRGEPAPDPPAPGNSRTVERCEQALL